MNYEDDLLIFAFVTHVLLLFFFLTSFLLTYFSFQNHTYKISVNISAAF